MDGRGEGEEQEEEGRTDTAQCIRPLRERQVLRLPRKSRRGDQRRRAYIRPPGEQALRLPPKSQRHSATPGRTSAPVQNTKPALRFTAAQRRRPSDARSTPGRTSWRAPSAAPATQITPAQGDPSSEATLQWGGQLTTGGVIITDAKGLNDHVNKTGSIASEKQTALDMLMVKRLVEDQVIRLRWVPTWKQMADPLTKEMARDLLLEFRKTNSLCLVETAEDQPARRTEASVSSQSPA